MRLGVIYFFFARLYAPFAPRSDNGHFGRKVLDGELKTHLVVTLAGAAVSYRVGTFLEGDIDKMLCDAGAGMAGAEQIFLIHRAGFHGGDDVVVNIFVGEVEHVKLRGAGCERFFLESFELIRLTYIGGDRDDLAVVVVFLEPRDDY